MNIIEVITRAINLGYILGANAFESVSVDTVLDGRSDPDFEAEWLRIFEDTKRFPVTAEQELQLLKLREAAFKAVFAGYGDPEICSYVTDDWDMIARNLVFSRNNGFLNALVESYSKGQIPHGPMISSIFDVTSFTGSLQKKIADL